MTAYEAMAERYEELFPPNPACARWFGRRLPPGGAILDAGCATGSLVRDLARAGHPALGIDPEVAMVERAARLAAGVDGARFAVGGMEDLASLAAPGSLAAIACLGNTLPHLVDSAALRRFMAACAALLAPDGFLATQLVNYSRPRIADGRERSFPALRGAAWTFERSWKPEGDAIRFRVSFSEGGKVAESTILLRAFDLPALEEAARRAGLSPEPPVSSWDDAPFSETESPFLIAAFRRPGALSPK